MASGVYCILNKINKKCYIGSSRNIDGRFANHKCELRQGKHCNPKLQAAWNKYGEDSFSFFYLEEIEFTTEEALQELEQAWFKKWEPEYNIDPVATRRKPLSEEARRKISEKNTGKKRSPEAREKMRQAKLRNPVNPWDYRKPYKASEETKQKQREGMLRYHASKGSKSE